MKNANAHDLRASPSSEQTDGIMMRKAGDRENWTRTKEGGGGGKTTRSV